MGRSNLHDFTLYVHHETPAALRVSETGEDRDAFWLPKSQIEYEEKGASYVLVTMPEWLAREKELSGF